MVKKMKCEHTDILAYIESVQKQIQKETELYLRCVFIPNSKQEIHLYKRCVKEANKNKRW